MLLPLFLSALGLLWLFGIFSAVAHCRKMEYAAVSQSLPFEDPTHAPASYKTAHFLYILSLLLMILAGAFLAALGLMKLQGLVVWRSDAIVLFNSENFLIFCFPCFFLSIGLYGAIYQKIIARFPGHEMYQAFISAKSPPSAWGVGELTRLVRKQRVSNAKVLAWTWLLAGVPVILGFDSYIQVTRNGLIVNGYWGLGEQYWGWQSLHHAQLYGGLKTSKRKLSFNPHFSVMTRKGQQVDLLGSQTPVPLLALASTYRAAAALRQNHVPVFVRGLNRREEEALRSKTPYWQGQIRRLWRDVAALPGVQIQDEGFRG